ncbi:Eukaryotic/viral aspartic protease [Phytophthora megakarya]|uniref:Eukaryotic/viral aspartic protease n=1 Tax=Phytophthora megakarya TaxID=4795 RepID=A0A225W410_9STRA|nr:Eukaryotic/viral aspartic protease [Phytophthora megakarya]
MWMRRPPRVMQLAAIPAEPENPSSEGAIPKALEDAIIRLMQSTRMQVAPGTTSSAPRYASTTPVPRHTTVDIAPQEPTDVAMESVSSHSSHGAGVARVRVSAFSELKEFNGKDANEEKARAWFNRLKSASRRDRKTGDEVYALFGDRMSGYWGKCVSMASRYYHASKHVDETPKIRYSDETPEEKREYVDLFINTLRAHEQELASRLTLIEVPEHVHVGEKASRATTWFSLPEEDLLRLKPFPPVGTDANTDAGQSRPCSPDDDDQICYQDRDDEERAKMFVTGYAPQQENARRDFGMGGMVHDRSNKIATTPVLKHFDTDKQPVVIVYARDWAVSAVLSQDHDGIYLPVNFTSRTLKPNELQYSIAEKEILALLRVLNECDNVVERDGKILEKAQSGLPLCPGHRL